MLVSTCPLRWLLITPAPWAEHSAALKILPRSFSPPGCEQQLPEHREIWGQLRFPAPWQAAPCRITSGRDWFIQGALFTGFDATSIPDPSDLLTKCSQQQGGLLLTLPDGAEGLSLSTCGCPAPHYLLHPSQWPALPGKPGVLWKQLKKGWKCPHSGEASAEHTLPFHYPSKHPLSFQKWKC